MRTPGKKKFLATSLIPIMGLLFIFVAIPILAGLILSVYDYHPLNEVNLFVGAKNYLKLLNDSNFIKSLFNTVKFVTISVSANLVLTLAIAIGINSIKNMKIKNFFRTIYFLPTIAPLAGSTIIWGTMFNTKTGLLNLLLDKVGIAGISWLTDPDIAMYSIIILTLWADIGFNIILFMSGLDSIPETFYEAAEVDGVSNWQKFRHITLPLLSRTSIFVVTMTIISYFQMFAQFQILTNGGPRNATSVLTLSIYKEGFVYSNMGYASAIASVLFTIIMIITLIQLKLGETDWEY